MQGSTHAGALALAGLVVAGTGPASAQPTYPDRPILVIVPQEGGSPADVSTRLLMERMRMTLGQPFAIENQPGAGGLIGTDRTAKAKPDGYTLGAFNDSIVTVLPNVEARLPYDAARDFAPVTTIATVPTVLLVHPSLPVKSMRDLTALAKARPGELRYGSSGNAGSEHLAMAMYRLAAGVDLTHVPYRGAVPALIALIDGQVQGMFIGLPPALPHLKAGHVRALATAGNGRTPLLPAVPTMAESGIRDFRYDAWIALYAPAGTPQDIVRRLNAAAVQALKTPDLQAQFARQGLEAVGSTTDQLAATAREDYTRMARVIKDTGIRGD
jgi:tripartite-type tricarboxylate transporter receptor subunit TctC